MNKLTTIRRVKASNYYLTTSHNQKEIVEILNRITQAIFILHLAKDKIKDITHFRITNNITSMIVNVSTDIKYLKINNS